MKKRMKEIRFGEGKKKLMKKTALIVLLTAVICSFSACLNNRSVPGVTNNPGNQNMVVNQAAPAPSEPVQTPDEGIDYDYWLRLDRAPGDYYETDVDGVNYRMTDYSNYITLYITNNNENEVSVGGEYKLQRCVGGTYEDVDDSMNLIYNGVPVQEMQLIRLYDEADRSEIVLSKDTDSFTVQPGQTVKAELLTMRFVIIDSPDYEGDYRLIYGDAVVDFRLYCDVVC